MKIQLKIALIFALLAASITAVLSIFIYLFSGKQSFDDFYKRLEIRAVVAAKSELEDAYHVEAYEKIRKSHLEKFPTEEEFFVQVQDDGFIVPEGRENELSHDFYMNVFRNGSGFYRDRNRFYSGIFYEGFKGRAIVIVSAENVYSIAYLASLRRILLTCFVISVFLAFTIGLLFARRIFSPFRRITTNVKDISSNNLHLRLPVEGNDEIGQLSATFNNMLDRLEASFETLNNFISNASHELGTPLTTIIGESEYALRKDRSTDEYRHSMAVILSEANRLDLITKNLLNLAQTGFDGTKMEWETVRIDELVLECIGTIHKAYEGSRIAVDYRLFPEDQSKLQVEGNRQLLSLAVSNVLLNACKYSENKPVTVRIAATDHKVVIIINDQGIGIPQQELKYIYDPFFRASNTRTFKGYGIGLPLTRNIMRLHSGKIEVTAEEHKGTTVKLEIPIRKK